MQNVVFFLTKQLRLSNAKMIDDKEYKMSKSSQNLSCLADQTVKKHSNLVMIELIENNKNDQNLQRVYLSS